MYSNEQKDIALRIYHQTESVTETIRILGYPTRRNLYTWIAEENTPPNLESLISKYILPIRPDRNYARQHRVQKPLSFSYRFV